MTDSRPFGTASQPLVLASGSAARRALLEAAMVPFEVQPASIDERAVEQPWRDAGATPAEIATRLAVAKAIAVSESRPGAVVLGADQVLAFEHRIFSKPIDLAAARETLLTLRGRAHELHAGWALVRDGAVLRSGVDHARLTMRAFSSAFLARYLEAEADAVCSSVGAYRLEGLGVQLFEDVTGHHATILGLPLLPVLAALRELGLLLI